MLFFILEITVYMLDFLLRCLLYKVAFDSFNSDTYNISDTL